jgi:hypothetical protein
MGQYAPALATHKENSDMYSAVLTRQLLSQQCDVCYRMADAKG